CLFITQSLAQRRLDVLERCNLEVDLAAEHDLCRPFGAGVTWIGDRKLEAALGGLVGKHRRFAQEARGEPVGDRGCRDELGEGEPRETVEKSDFIREVVRRQVAQFPKSSQRQLWGMTVGRFET